MLQVDPPPTLPPTPTKEKILSKNPVLSGAKDGVEINVLITTEDISGCTNEASKSLYICIF